jgi:hypothetical protein
VEGAAGAGLGVDRFGHDDMRGKLRRVSSAPERPPTVPMLRVAVQGNEIVVTASDTDYVMTYHKPANSPDFSLGASRGKRTGVSL